MSLPFLTSAPGKVILFGEHSAVYEKRAIAASINSLRTYLYVSESTDNNTITLDFPDINFHHTWKHTQLSNIDIPLDHTIIDSIISNQIHSVITKSNITDPLHINATFCFLYLYKCLIPQTSNIQFKLISTSPIGAGLGSSAAVSVVLSQSMLHLSNKPQDKDEINKYAFLGEKCIHGDPSGIDNLVSVHGGAISYQKNGITRILNLTENNNLILTYTKIPRSTKTLVSGVRSLYQALPQIIEPILTAMDQIAIRAETLLLSPANTEALTQLIIINQALLESLNVSHDSIEKIKLLSNKLNIGPTKLTGAGGGGCTFTLITNNDKLSQFKTILNQDYHFETIETQLGGAGCLIVPNNKLSSRLIQDIDSLFNSTNNLTRSQIDQLLLPGVTQVLPWE